MTLLAAALATPAARADTLGDVRTFLASLTARDPVRAAVKIEVRSASGEKDAKAAPQPETATVTVEASAGSDGLTLNASPELLAALRKGKHAPGGSKQAARSLDAPLREARLEAFEALLDGGRALAAGISDATLVREAPDTFGGAPAHLVVLRLDPQLSDEDRKHVKEMTMEARIWLDAGSCPLASEIVMDTKFRIFLLSADVHERVWREYIRLGDRLVTAREVREERSSGMGQHSQSTVTITVTPYTPRTAAGPTPVASPASPSAGASPAHAPTPASPNPPPAR